MSSLYFCKLWAQFFPGSECCLMTGEAWSGGVRNLVMVSPRLLQAQSSQETGLTYNTGAKHFMPAEGQYSRDLLHHAPDMFFLPQIFSLCWSRRQEWLVLKPSPLTVLQPAILHIGYHQLHYSQDIQLQPSPLCHLCQKKFVSEKSIKDENRVDNTLQELQLIEKRSYSTKP